jgi:hypothetical protein
MRRTLQLLFVLLASISSICEATPSPYGTASQGVRSLARYMEQQHVNCARPGIPMSTRVDCWTKKEKAATALNDVESRIDKIAEHYQDAIDHAPSDKKTAYVVELADFYIRFGRYCDAKDQYPEASIADMPDIVATRVEAEWACAAQSPDDRQAAIEEGMATAYDFFRSTPAGSNLQFQNRVFQSWFDLFRLPIPPQKTGRDDILQWIWSESTIGLRSKWGEMVDYARRFHQMKSGNLVPRSVAELKCQYLAILDDPTPCYPK